MLSRCSSRGGAMLFWRLRGRGRALLVSSTCCITRSVLQLCVGASRLAGGGGVKSLLLRERWWRWWWRWRRRAEVLIYHRPSLPVSWDALQLLGVCIIPYKIKAPQFPHNTYCFIHIACDTSNVVHAPALSLSLPLQL